MASTDAPRRRVEQGIQLWNAILDEVRPGLRGPDRGSDHVHHHLLGGAGPEGHHRHHRLRHGEGHHQGPTRAGARHRRRPRLPVQRQGRPGHARRLRPRCPPGQLRRRRSADPALRALRDVTHPGLRSPEPATGSVRHGPGAGESHALTRPCAAPRSTRSPPPALTTRSHHPRDDDDRRPPHPPSDPAPTRTAPFALLAIALVLVAGTLACGSDDDGGSGTTDPTTVEGALGTPDAATDTPVKVGFISDGRTPSVDNSAFAVAAKATVDYANDYMGGIGGHQIELVECATTGDPGKATDCANEMVQDDVVLVLMPESLQPTAVNTVTQANSVPLFIYAVTDAAILEADDYTYNMGNRASALSTLPIDVAEENDLDKVSILVVDVPAATSGYEGALAPEFEDAGVELNLVKVPLGQADISQQIIGIVDGGPTEVHIVGDATLCIAGINGLRTNGFTGPISTVTNCLNDAIKEAIGANIDGLTTAALAPTEDPTNTGPPALGRDPGGVRPGLRGPVRGPHHVHDRLLGAADAAGHERRDHHRDGEHHHPHVTRAAPGHG